MKTFNIPLLTTDDIEVKIKQCTKAGAVALLYKTARVDYRILDEVFGPLGWQVEYTEIKNNLYCTISLWDEENKQWVKKTNCGIESREDGEGNEKKGEASDAAKRAGTVVGIGAELYSSPYIFMNVATEEDKNNKYKLKDPYAKYVVTKIAYNESTRVITSLEICNEKTGVVVFSWDMPKSGARAKKMKKTVEGVESAGTPAPQANSQPAAESVSNEPKMPLKSLVTNIGLIAKKMAEKDGDLSPYTKIVAEVTGNASFKCSKATEKEYDLVLKIYQALVAAGYDK